MKKGDKLVYVGHTDACKQDCSGGTSDAWAIFLNETAEVIDPNEGYDTVGVFMAGGPRWGYRDHFKQS